MTKLLKNRIEKILEERGMKRVILEESQLEKFSTPQTTMTYKRWSSIRQNEIDITLFEAIKIAEWLRVELSEIFEWQPARKKSSVPA